MDNIIDAGLLLFSVGPLFAMLLGSVIGMVVGSTPGLTATMTIALAIPFTYNIGVLSALGLIAGIHNGAGYGGAIPAILLRIPGTPGSIVTAWDGYPMREQGNAGAALRLAAVSNAVGGVLGALAFLVLAPLLAKVTLAFGPIEIFWVNVFGLTSIVLLIGSDALKGIISACFGLLVGTVGLDTVTAHERFTFGVPQLVPGVSLLVFMMGMYALPPVWDMVQGNAHVIIEKGDLLRQPGKKLWSWPRIFVTWARSSVISIVLGILPGVGGVGSFIAYNETRRASPSPETFGKGNPEGLAAAESAGNADNAAAMIPTLTLGIPGSAVAALILGALLIHGIQPGPRIFTHSPEIVYGYAIAMIVTSIIVGCSGGTTATLLYAQVLRLSPKILMPIILCIVVAGAYSYQSIAVDVWFVLLLGLIGYAMERLKFEIAPAVIGLILGVPAEYNLRLALLISNGDLGALYGSNISRIVIALVAVVLIFPAVRAMRRGRG